MIFLSQLRRVVCPALLLSLALAVVLFDGPIEQLARVSLGMTGEVLAFIAAAWLGSRIFGLHAARRAQHKRPYPRLFHDLVATSLFLLALACSAALLLDQGVLGALAGSSLVLAMLGFAIRNVVADTLSGIALGIEASYRIGDWIDIEQVARGRVIEIGWRTTRLLTQDSTYMILPNSQIARRRITNFSAPKPQYRAQLSIKLGHDLPVKTAKALILQTLSEAKLIQAAPPPDVKVQELAGDGIHYAVRFWLSRFERDADARDEVLSLIDRVLREENIPAPRVQIELQRSAFLSRQIHSARA